MHLAGKILRGFGVVVCAIAVLFYSGTLLVLILSFTAGTAEGENATIVGRILGTLFADLVFLAIGTRLWKALTRKS